MEVYNTNMSKSPFVDSVMMACDLSNDSIVITDERGKVQWINQTFTKKTGYAIQDMRGKTPGSVLQGDSSDPSDIESFKKKLDKGVPFEQSIMNHAKDGSLLRTTTTITPIRDANGCITNFIGVQRFLGNGSKGRNDAETTLLGVMEQLSTKYEELAKRQQEIEIQNNTLQESYRLLQRLNNKVNSSVNYASRLQYSLMPREAWIEKALKQSFILNRPKDTVSGDFYWFEETDEWQRILVGDCTGHGVSGALMTVMAINLLDQFVGKVDIKALPKAFDDLDVALRKKLDMNSETGLSSDGFEFGMLQFDKGSDDYHYIGGMIDLIRIDDNGAKKVRANRLPIGGDQRFYKGRSFEKIHSFRKKKGESVYLFSDGFPDQFNDRNDKKFTSRKFRESLAGICHMDAQRQKMALMDILRKWKGKQQQTDDILVFGHRF